MSDRHSMGALAILILAGAVGCKPVFPGPPEITLGYGDEQFTAVDDGDAAPIIFGPQGGYHIWGAVRARYFDPDGIRLVFRLTPPNGRPPSIRTIDTDLEHADDGVAFGDSLRTQVYLPDVTAFQGQPCRWRVDATDQEGRGAGDENMVIPTGP